MLFGIGQRRCTGDDLALMEGQVALAMIAQRYTLISTSETPLNRNSPLLCDERRLDRQVVKMKVRRLPVVELRPSIIRECPSQNMRVVPQHHEQTYSYGNKY
jgi:hypothetical protein